MGGIINIMLATVLERVDIRCVRGAVVTGAGSGIGRAAAPAPRPRSAPYTATKHAITGLTRRAVLQLTNLPLDANVLFISLTATKMPYVGRG